MTLLLVAEILMELIEPKMQDTRERIVMDVYISFAVSNMALPVCK